MFLYKEVMTLSKQYDFSLTIASYDVGPDNRLKPSAVLRYQQEAAERQLAALGMGWDTQLATGMAFVSARWRGVFTRLPAMGEAVTLTTWHHAARGAKFIRHYRWTDDSGAVIIQGVMVFGLVSLADRKLLRAEALAALGDIPACEETVDCAPPSRLVTAPVEPVYSHTVGWSDTDRNGHLNNTRYADLVCDALGERLATGRVAEMQMHFANEVKAGQTVTVAASAGNPALVCGTTAQGVSFEAEVRLV